jgi:uncharacterized repeat protein (TIGR03803 family)
MASLSALKKTFAILLLCFATTIGVSAQTFTSLFSFDLGDGEFPNGPLAQGTDGNLYGTTNGGGEYYEGTVFRITTAGQLTTLHAFDLTDGFEPFTGLIQATDGNFYGTTYLGGGTGGLGGGTVFKITEHGELTTDYIFCSQPQCADGSQPFAGLVQSVGGTLFGSTQKGGTNQAGTIFKITTEGQLITVHDIGGTDADNPSILIQASDGNFYGTASFGGLYGGGTLFKMTPSGQLTTIYNFCNQLGCTGGYMPNGIVQASDGNFYGTTMFGGILNQSQGGGIFFKITPTGTLTTLYEFCVSLNGVCPDGTNPSGVTLATDGNFYGTTQSGGNNYLGTIFNITAQGRITTLHTFDGYDGSGGGVSGANVMMQATNGQFYGTTVYGGAPICHHDKFSCGTIFSVDMGLAPFVTPRPVAGKVGTSVIILGNGLTGTTAVSFNGAPATFIINADTAITAKIPSGATSGPIQVTTSAGTLTSNITFRVLN